MKKYIIFMFIFCFNILAGDNNANNNKRPRDWDNSGFTSNKKSCLRQWTIYLYALSINGLIFNNPDGYKEKIEEYITKNGVEEIIIDFSAFDKYTEFQKETIDKLALINSFQELPIHIINYPHEQDIDYELELARKFKKLSSITNKFIISNKNNNFNFKSSFNNYSSTSFKANFNNFKSNSNFNFNNNSNYSANYNYSSNNFTNNTNQYNNSDKIKLDIDDLSKNCAIINNRATELILSGGFDYRELLKALTNIHNSYDFKNIIKLTIIDSNLHKTLLKKLELKAFPNLKILDLTKGVLSSNWDSIWIGIKDFHKKYSSLRLIIDSSLLSYISNNFSAEDHSFLSIKNNTSNNPNIWHGIRLNASDLINGNININNNDTLILMCENNFGIILNAFVYRNRIYDFSNINEIKFADFVLTSEIVSALGNINLAGFNKFQTLDISAGELNTNSSICSDIWKDMQTFNEKYPNIFIKISYGLFQYLERYHKYENKDFLIY